MTVKKIETLVELLEEFTGQRITWDTFCGSEGKSEQISFPLEVLGENGQKITGLRCWIDESCCPYVGAFTVNQKLADYFSIYCPPVKIEKREEED